ncbi:MAG: hypothetical protein ACFFBD_19620 [Candidatus Hodarchaeota archaeon]
MEQLLLKINLLQSLPDTIGYLTSLQVLDLGHNLLKSLPKHELTSSTF